MKTYYFKLYCFMIQALAAQFTYAGEPGWAKDMPKRIGFYLFVSCHGLGPDRSFSYRQALDQCRSIASDQISGNFKVKTISMETESDSGFHQEVSSDTHVDGLICNVENNVEQEVDGSSETYLRCKFDVRKARMVPAKDPSFKRKSALVSSNKSLIVSTIPKCNSLVIRGKTQRMIRCKNNPQQVTIYPEDMEVLVRANGYQPKHAGIPEGDTLEVYLERN